LEIQTRADVRLLGRAVREDWPTSPQKKREAMKALMDVIALRDPELTIEAVKVLIKADEANMKRQEIGLKQQALDDARRLQLLELARHLPVGELARIASDNSHDAGATRQPEG
jgi:hypothetical protein